MRILKKEDLYLKTSLGDLNFETSEELNNDCYIILGQEKLEKQFVRAIKNKNTGYNVFLVGNSFQREKFIMSLIEKNRDKDKVLHDICVLNNESDIKNPFILKLKSGAGRELANSFNEFLFSLKTEVSGILNSLEFKKRENDLFKELTNGLDDLISTYNDLTIPLKHLLIKQDSVIAPYPISDSGELLSMEDIDNLSDEEYDSYELGKMEVQELLIQLNHELSILNQKYQEDVKSLEHSLISQFVEPKIVKFISEFEKGNGILTKFLQNFKEKIMSDYESLLDIKTDENKSENLLNEYYGSHKDSIEDIYFIHLVLDTKGKIGQPVVHINEEITYGKLFGCIMENKNHEKNKKAKYEILSGEILKANGGYLVLDAKELLRSNDSWMELKTILNTKSIDLYPLDTTDKDNLPTNINIPIDIKVILYAGEDLFEAFSNDFEFASLFKSQIFLNSSIERTDNNEKKFALHIASMARENGSYPLTKEAICLLIELMARDAQDKNSLSLRINYILNLIEESHVIAEEEGLNVITKNHIKETIETQESFLEEYKNYDNVNYTRNRVLIDTTGYKNGVINGLCVRDFGSCMVGSPMRITANIYSGEEGVISVDRNVELSGTIHDKCVEIIRGYIGSRFYKVQKPNTIANLCFEQTYGMVDGDSATLAETCCILSEMDNKPINQGIAITGSMNQKGEVQVVGGVNAKIEGFFNVCKLRKLTGNQGVIIPENNSYDLMLSEEVVEAVEKGLFTIYTVDTIDEAFEILTK